MRKIWCKPCDPVDVIQRLVELAGAACRGVQQIQGGFQLHVQLKGLAILRLCLVRQLLQLLGHTGNGLCRQGWMETGLDTPRLFELRVQGGDLACELLQGLRHLVQGSGRGGFHRGFDLVDIRSGEGGSTRGQGRCAQHQGGDSPHESQRLHEPQGTANDHGDLLAVGPVKV